MIKERFKGKPLNHFRRKRWFNCT